jgi:site-specific recombinase XerD
MAIRWKDCSSPPPTLSNTTNDLNQKASHLRHTFAYLFLKKYPGDIRTLADLLGHNDLKTTMRYTASTESDKAAKMAGMD